MEGNPQLSISQGSFNVDDERGRWFNEFPLTLSSSSSTSGIPDPGGPTSVKLILFIKSSCT